MDNKCMKLRRFLIILIAGFSLAISGAIGLSGNAFAKPKAKSKKHVKTNKKQTSKKDENDKGKKNLKGSALFSSVWKKTKVSGSKNIEKDGKKPPKGSVAGVRGAKKDGGYLKPYWKGDDKQEQEREASRIFLRASDLIDKKKFKDAVELLKKYLAKYTGTRSEPEVRVALGLCLAETGQIPEAKETLTKFIEKYPAHPLAQDAKKVMEDLADTK